VRIWGIGRTTCGIPGEIRTRITDRTGEDATVVADSLVPGWASGTPLPMGRGWVADLSATWRSLCRPIDGELTLEAELSPGVWLAVPYDVGATSPPECTEPDAASGLDPLSVMNTEPPPLPSHLSRPTDRPDATVVPPAPGPTASVGACKTNALSIRISRAEGSAGSRFMSVDIISVIAAPCHLATTLGSRLYDADLKVVAESPSVAAPALVLEQEVPVSGRIQWTNWCAPTIATPLTLAIVLPDGSELVDPLLTGERAVPPPCTAPGSPSTISPIDLAP
jgi:hypothetical protein